METGIRNQCCRLSEENMKRMSVMAMTKNARSEEAASPVVAWSKDPELGSPITLTLRFIALALEFALLEL
jgi:hypothetical protein